MAATKGKSHDTLAHRNEQHEAEKQSSLEMCHLLIRLDRRSIEEMLSSGQPLPILSEWISLHLDFTQHTHTEHLDSVISSATPNNPVNGIKMELECRQVAPDPTVLCRPLSCLKLAVELQLYSPSPSPSSGHSPSGCFFWSFIYLELLLFLNNF